MLNTLGHHTNRDYQTELHTLQAQINALTGKITIGDFHSHEDQHNTHSRLHNLQTQEKNLRREAAMENQRIDRLAAAVRTAGDPDLGFIAYVVFGPAALPVAPLYEIRLLDEYGYTVGGTIRTNLPASRVEKARRELLTVDAPRHAGLWGAHVSAYRVQVTPF
ncbi:hypothetical protein [Streptomyces ardesiacus]|uniref:hypothetical protein n=1 Tax=Streptomyces ardesiacus TaxID=285564 RepID=UPI003F4A47A0